MTVSTSSFLLLLPPSVVADPAKVEELLAKYSDGPTFQHQVLDRVVTKAVGLSPGSYSRIHLANPVDDEGIIDDSVKLDGSAFEIFLPALASGGVLTGAAHHKESSLPALLAGFVPSDNGALAKPLSATNKVPVRPLNRTAGSVPLKRTNGGAKKTSLPQFKKLTEKAVTLNLDDDDEDDFIDENDLVDGVDLSPAIVLPAKCDPGPGKRRKKACKDCSCGLKELEEQGIEEQHSKQQSVISLAVDETAEIDFTIPGKTTGSCGSCALGDAFRCDGCPYIGLPPFKPGEVVSITALGGDDF